MTATWFWAADGLKQLNDEKAHNLLLLHQGAIGDFVLTLSVVQAVCTYLRNTHVLAVASAPSARLAAGRSVIAQYIAPDDVALHTLFNPQGEIGPRLHEILQEADLVMSFLGGEAEPVHERLVQATAGRVLSIDPRPTAETLTQRRHITRQWSADVHRYGLAIPQPTPPRIHLDRDRQEAGLQYASPARRFILHPGSGGRSKCWPLARFIELAESLREGKVTWMLGPAEGERAPEMVNLIRSRSAAAGEALLIEPDLGKAAAHIASADLYVGNDAGMTHLAAALGAPTVAVFTSTDLSVWRPLGPHVHAVSTMDTLEMAGPGQVLQVIRGILY